MKVQFRDGIIRCAVRMGGMVTIPVGLDGVLESIEFTPEEREIILKDHGYTLSPPMRCLTSEGWMADAFLVSNSKGPFGWIYNGIGQWGWHLILPATAPTPTWENSLRSAYDGCCSAHRETRKGEV